MIAAQAVHYAALFALFGGALFRLYAGASLLDPWLARVLRIAALAALLSALAWWYVLTALLIGGLADALHADALAAVLLDTEFGGVWQLRLVLLAALVVMAALGLSHTKIAAVAGLALVTLAGIGHGAQAGVPEELATGAKAAHFLAAGAWLGGLAPLGYVLRRGARGEAEWAALARQALPRFSSMGYFAVSLILLSGVLLAWSHVESLAALTGTAYGRALIAKVLLFLLMTAIALYNRYRLLPAGSLPALARSVALEQAVGVAILIVAALIANLPPAHAL
jgi:putative copper resistance protein D